MIIRDGFRGKVNIGIGDMRQDIKFHDGTVSGSGGHAFVGLIDEVRVINLALTSVEVQALMTDLPGYQDSGTVSIIVSAGNALDFDSVDDYVDIDSAADDMVGNDSNYTVEAWVRFDSVGAEDRGIIAVNAPSADKLWFSMNTSGNIKVQDVDAGASGEIVGPVLTLDTWYHVAYVRDGVVGTLYVNGASEGTGDTGLTFEATDRWSIGHEWDGAVSGNFMDGQIDEVRIWIVSRSQAQIQGAMYSELGGSETGLVAYYKMEDADATSATDITLSDSSGNANTGALTNMDAAIAWAGHIWVPDAAASNGGLTMMDNSFLNDNGDDILFIHNGMSGNTTSGTGFATLYPSGQRWERIWTCDVNDTAGNGGSVDLVFDFVKADMGGDPAPTNTPANYKLVHVDNVGVWTEKVGAATSVDVGARTVTFENVDTTGLCSGITLATSDTDVSPTAITVQTFTANSPTNIVLLLTAVLMLGITVYVVISNRRVVKKTRDG